MGLKLLETVRRMKDTDYVIKSAKAADFVVRRLTRKGLR